VDGAQILVVDDDDDLRIVFAEFLTSYGYTVAEARNGLEALEYLRANPVLPELIFLDVMMPVMAAEEFLAERRKDPRLVVTPVYLFTAREGVDPVKMGAQRMFRKPVDVDAVLEAVAEIMKPLQPDFPVGPQ
jgi:two-component system, chemotaxis family, chemotaxis protein CheY